MLVCVQVLAEPELAKVAAADLLAHAIVGSNHELRATTGGTRRSLLSCRLLLLLLLRCGVVGGRGGVEIDAGQVVHVVHACGVESDGGVGARGAAAVVDVGIVKANVGRGDGHLTSGHVHLDCVVAYAHVGFKQSVRS